MDGNVVLGGYCLDYSRLGPDVCVKSLRVAEATAKLEVNGNLAIWQPKSGSTITETGYKVIEYAFHPASMLSICDTSRLAPNDVSIESHFVCNPFQFELSLFGIIPTIIIVIVELGPLAKSIVRECVSGARKCITMGILYPFSVPANLPTFNLSRSISPSVCIGIVSQQQQQPHEYTPTTHEIRPKC